MLSSLTGMQLAGPMYGGPLHHPGFVQTILGYLPTLDRNVYGTAARIEGMLRTAYEELSPHIHSHEQAESARAAEQTELAAASSEAALLARTDPALIDRHPFYFFPSALSALLHVQSPPEAAFKGALRHAGYWVSRSHAQPGSIKTDAPWSFLWHLMREWVRQRCTPKEGSLKKTMPGWLLMHPRQNDSGPATDNNAGADAAKTDAKTDANGSEGQSVKSGRQSDKQFPPVVFNEALGRDRPSKKLVRYQMNPRRNWGPMAKAA